MYVNAGSMEAATDLEYCAMTIYPINTTEWFATLKSQRLKTALEQLRGTTKLATTKMKSLERVTRNLWPQLPL